MSGRPRILIVGNAGQVGVELQRCFAGVGEIVGVDRESVDLAQADQVRALVRRVEPKIILNAAAYTAVDRAESEPELAQAINAEAPRIMAEEAIRSDALLVHYSTDYVFDGAKQGPWIEQDTPAPLNVYGASKLAGEEAILQAGGKVLIFRTSWVYGPHGSNFLLTMLRLALQRDSLSIVSDQIGSPTTSIELARATHQIVSRVMTGQFGSVQDWSGLYHMTCSGSTSWCGFAQAIFARAGKLLDGKLPVVTPITSEEYPTPAKRPRNSVLSNAKLEGCFGVQLAPWEAALDEVIQALK
ncbi:MAG: dTDP-4-dehydrorhamnose reductase [Terracidiphilus sp.]